MAVNRESFPNRITESDVECKNTTIKSANKSFPLPNSHAAIDNIATRIDGPLGRDFGIVGPELLSCFCSYREDFAPGGGEVHHAVDHDGGCFLATTGIQDHIPGTSKVAYGLML